MKEIITNETYSHIVTWILTMSLEKLEDCWETYYRRSNKKCRLKRNTPLNFKLLLKSTELEEKCDDIFIESFYRGKIEREDLYIGFNGKNFVSLDKEQAKLFFQYDLLTIYNRMINEEWDAIAYNLYEELTQHQLLTSKFISII